MKLVIQRVKKASVTVNNELISEINQGLLILVGFADSDTDSISSKHINKLLNMRIFSDINQKMNLNIRQVEGEILVVSQFTLYADLTKGNRPSFMKAAHPKFAENLYKNFVETLKKEYPDKIKSGVFGANMEVLLCNDGPVTILLE